MATSSNIDFGEMRALFHFRTTGVALGLATLLLLAAGAQPARAGVGVAVALDLPSQVKVGESDLDGTITVVNVNNLGDADLSNLVYGITLTPSCASRAISNMCPTGNEEPRVFTVDPVAVGRTGSACEGVSFAVTESDAATGELEFTPPDGHVVVGPADGLPGTERCIIDFSLSLNARPAKDSNPSPQKLLARTIETTAYAGALAVTEGGMRPGIGGNVKTLRIE